MIGHVTKLNTETKQELEHNIKTEHIICKRDTVFSL